VRPPQLRLWLAQADHVELVSIVIHRADNCALVEIVIGVLRATCFACLVASGARHSFCQDAEDHFY
jgi:hypothetical protein